MKDIYARTNDSFDDYKAFCWNKTKMQDKARYLLALCLFLICSCAADELEPPKGCESIGLSYADGVKNIIDQTCAYAGCHDGSGGIGPGNYTSYDGLVSVIQDGTFIERTIDMRNNPSLGMPPNNSVYPESQQDDLSEIQLEIIRCWIQNGYPQ